MANKNSELDNFNNSLAKRYKDNPLPKAVLSTLSNIPAVGIIVAGGQVILEHKVDQIYYERLIALLDELNANYQAIPEDILTTEPFVHSVFLIYRSAINTFSREKNKIFCKATKVQHSYGRTSN